MTRTTNEERIIARLLDRPGLDDDELSKATGISPRQQVNQICRRLESRGLVRREPGAHGKIVNFLQSSGEFSSSAPSREATVPGAPLEQIRRSHVQHEHAVPRAIECDPGTTLFIFPCSGSKERRQDMRTQGPSILDQLPPLLGQRLADARTRIRARAHMDETSMIPAWERYTGSLYQAGRDAIEAALESGVHIIIVSGGYGLVLAAEPIGYYEAVFRNSWWPNRVLDEVILDYLRRHRLRAVCAVASATTEYAKLLRRVNWHSVELENAVLLSPEETTGAMVKSPRAQGEAVSMLLQGGLAMNWQSSDGLRLTSTRLV